MPADIIANIIDAGRWAPSAHNLQPWKFVVVEDRETINNISDALTHKAKKLLNYHPKVSIDDGLRKTYEWIKQNTI